MFSSVTYSGTAPPDTPDTPHDAEPRQMPPDPLPRWRRTAQAWGLVGLLLLFSAGAFFSLHSPPPATPSTPAAPVPAPPALPDPARAAEAPQTTASAASATSELPAAAAEPAPKPRVAARPRRAGDARCADWLARIQLGETLSDEAQNAYRKECR